MQDIINQLTNKNDTSAYSLTKQIVSESQESNQWYKYFDLFASLLNHPKSYVRNRMISILSENARWDQENKFDMIIDDYLSHITDEKPITARLCIQSLIQIGQAKPHYVSKIYIYLINADLSKYKESMISLIKKDIENTKKALLKYQYVTLKEVPEYIHTAAKWFHDQWNVDIDAYLECMKAYLNDETLYGWYLCLDHQQIIGGLGVIENDFHNRRDLTPNICAVYVENDYRNQGIAGHLLNMAVEDLRLKNISPVYLITDHTHFYEKYGWEFYDFVQCEHEKELSRIYIHR